MRHEAPKKLPPAWKGRSAADVWGACFGHPCAHLPPPDYEALALDESGVIGVGYVYVRRMSGPGKHVLVGWMAAAAVLPEKQKQGIGSALLRERCDWLRSKHVPFGALHCEETLVAHNEKCGFRRAPNIPGPGVAMVCEVLGKSLPDVRFTYREPW